MAPVTDWIILADDLRDLENLGAPYRLATTGDYVWLPAVFERSGQRLINLSRNYNYQSDGYHASLLAEARGHRIIPMVETILDLEGRHGFEKALPELEDALGKDLADTQSADIPERILFCLGQPDFPPVKRFARLLFDWFRAPILSVRLSVTGAGANRSIRIQNIKTRGINTLSKEERAHFAASLAVYCKRSWRSPKPRMVPRYSIGLLFDPKDPQPPSALSSLKHWARIAEKQGVEVEPIQKRDISRLAEFDALFIRETTSIRDHTYRFARRAWAEGMPVIDDPISMIRCTNKVFLWERLSLAGLPQPKTMAVRPSTPLAMVADEIGFPVVIKAPDSSFSRGVKKADNMAELEALTKLWFEDSDLLLAQKFIPTSFDWRIGVLGGELLFAAQYPMVRGHWQIVNNKADGTVTQGGCKAVPLADVPPEVLDAGIHAARLIGDGLYGVDLKETPDGVFIMEINDNPNIDHGYEDAEEKNAVWLSLTRWFVDRLQA
ncbi:MAG: RimK family alpha-L-glutamate ligase [Rhizobiales bacterium]|nr:RimK family alpha-L-glutamate ligase [Hyphomicrobiales bacterium]